MTTALTVREISRDEHLAAISQRPSVSFLQTPAWGAVKREWAAESVGWFEHDSLVGIALILYRQAPYIKRSLAYVPEGPCIEWDDVVKSGNVDQWMRPLVDHVRSRGAFGLRIGPTIVRRRWNNSTVKQGLADPSVNLLTDMEPDEINATTEAIADQLTAGGWRPQHGEDGFGAGQPRHVFQLPLGDRSEDNVLRGFNQLWRRNVKKAAKSGVTVTLGSAHDLPVFHELYWETAERDGFTPRPLSYFDGMWHAMSEEADDRIRLYLAHHEHDLVAATTMVRVGTHAWYSYGASSTAKRNVRGSNAIQWQMIRDAIADGCDVYDLRGITDTLREDDPHVGLIRFKVGTGGHAVEYLGEWDLPISRTWYTAFDQYMKRRG